MGIIRLTLILLFLVINTFKVYGSTGCDSLFYTPECLKDNLAFWQMIYRSIPSSKGLIHDQDSFRIIYDTITVGDYQGRARSLSIRKKEKEVANILKSMSQIDTSNWDPIMRSYALKWGRPLTNNELLAASERVRFQLGQRDHFIEGLKRSGRYLDHIKKILESYGLPVELSYLPHVESSFNYRAYSKVGAAGIWQFMRNTGRLYLKEGYIVDERLDPIKATHAAAKLLRSNYNKLHSWPLAVTAYNHGAGSMGRAVTQTGTTDIGVIIDSYQTRSFQFASKNFYASFLAAYETAVNYKKYFGDVEMEPPFSYTEYPLPKSYRPSNISQIFKIPLKTLQDYNLDIRPTVFKGNQYLPKDYVLKLPIGYETLNRDSIMSHVPEKVAMEIPPQSGYHKVETGENLERIAAMYQVSLNDIINLNNLNPQSCIFPGQMIAIPGKTEIAAALPVKKALPIPMPVKINDIVPVHNPARDKIQKPISDSSAVSKEISVNKPDTASSSIVPSYLIAEKPAQPAIMDSVKNLWGYFYSAELALSLECVRKCEFCEFNADYYDMDFVKETSNNVEIKVQIDETLGHYAEWSGIPSLKLRNINKISSNIYLGEHITLPLAAEAAQAFLKARIEYHMAIEEDFFNNYEVTGMDTLIAKPGANVWTICQDNDIPLWLFLKSNPDIRDLRSIKAGAIMLPQVEEKKQGK